MPRPCFKLELPFPEPLAGVDEAGCAPLAGPVVAAAVVLDRNRFPRGLDDSKLVPVRQRESLYRRLQDQARCGVGIASVEEIETLNIYWARMLAMTRAVEALGVEPAWVLVDGNATPRWSRPSKAIVRGDAKCRSIAAASIIAKVTRDRIMADYCAQYPGYGWSRNKGYPTPDHRHAIAKLGITPLHRRGFAGVREHVPDLLAAEWPVLPSRISGRDLGGGNEPQALPFPEIRAGFSDRLAAKPANESFESHHLPLSPRGRSEHNI